MEEHIMRNSKLYNVSRTSNFLLFLGIMLAGITVMSNLLATKIWQIGPLIFDGGLILFPLACVIIDIASELYGRRVANRAAINCAAINLIAIAAFTIVNWLPDAPGVNNVNLAVVFQQYARLSIASTIAFVARSLVNNALYEALRERTAPGQIARRAWRSSFFARIIDTILFNTIAFWGRMSFGGLTKLMLIAFVTGLIIETFFLWLVVAVCRAVRGDIDDSDDDSEDWYDDDDLDFDDDSE